MNISCPISLANTDHFYKNESGPTVIDIFSGSGGLSYGFYKKGFNILSAIDNNPEALVTYQKNIKTSFSPKLKNITNIAPNSLMKDLDIHPGKLDLLIGGPPCQGFSSANKQYTQTRNLKNRLVYSYIKFLKDLNPRFFVMENVLGFKTYSNSKYINHFLMNIKKMGYNYISLNLNCEKLGIPQRRNRIFIIGAFKTEKIDLQKIKLIQRKKIITLKEALDDLPELPNGNQQDPIDYKRNSHLSNYQKLMRRDNSIKKVFNNLVTRNRDYVIERLKKIPPGKNWRAIKHLLKNYSNLENTHGSIYRRLKWNEPSITITNFRKNMIIHPEENRLLSVREAARIQSFPDNFIFYGGLSSQQQQVANAVPPLIAEKIAQKLLKFF